MRACWLDAGNNPDPVALAKHGVKTTLWPAYDPFTTEANIDAWRSDYAQGIYVAQNWSAASPSVFAALCSKAVHDLGGDDKPLVVHVDIELHDPQYVIDFLAAWRSSRPRRATWWVLEGMQGDGLTAELVAAVNADSHLNVLPCAYTGTMQPLGDDRVRADLVSAGITRGRVAPMYDAAELADKWDGCAFTQGRLK